MPRWTTSRSLVIVAVAVLAFPAAAVLPEGAAPVHRAIAARAPGEVGWGVVVFDAAPDAATLAGLASGFSIVHPWKLIPAVGLVGPRESFLALASAPGVVRVDASEARLHLRQSTWQIGAPAAWAGPPGYTGAGVVVAVLDTGIDDKHPDLDGGKVLERVSFETYPAGVPGTHAIPGAVLVDGFGHGTHVASTVAGSGDVPGVQFPADRYLGVAPGASLVSVQISTSGGPTANVEGHRISLWASLDAIQWTVDNAARLGIRVVVNSWGNDMEFDGYDVCLDDPVALAIRAAILAAPTLTWVFAAGNDGPDAGTINSPACLPEVVAVGAVDRLDRIAGFSGRGPSIGDGHAKPDVVAPGVGIVAAQTLNPSAYSAFNAADKLLKTGPRDAAQGAFYTSSSGTSMATPHVGGLVALMVEAAPCLTAADALSILKATAFDLGPSGFDDSYGAGRVDAFAAVAAADALC